MMKDIEQTLNQLKQILQRHLVDQAEDARCQALLNRIEQQVLEAYFDPVTQLPNRSQLNAYLKTAIVQSQRTENPVAVLFVDLDRFKYVNDTLGHQAGDALLKQVAQRLQGSVRKSDWVLRIGGDEFVLILPEQNALPKLEALAEKMIDHLSQPYHLTEGLAQIGASIGVAVGGGTQTPAMEALSAYISRLIEQADEAMYQAKQAGRGCIRFYNAFLEAENRKRLRLERTLQQAIALEQLHVTYESVCDLQQMEVDGIEARWSAAEVDLAGMSLEQALKWIDNRDLNETLSCQLIERALDFLQALVEAGHGYKMAFNVGVEQLQNPEFPRWLERQLLQRDLTPEWVILELDESNFALERTDVIAQLQKLSRLGVGLTLDNVGKGAFPFSLLQLAEIDNVKISEALTQGLLQDEVAFQLVKGLIALCQALGKAVVIEGVETQDQLLTLKSLGCDLIQGRFLGEPQSAETFRQQHLDELSGDLHWVHKVKHALSEMEDEDF